MNRIAIIGLGYVGLPLALLCSTKGHNVIGYDVNKDKLKQYKSRKYLEGEEYLYDWNDGNIKYTSEPKHIKRCNIKIVCVPTPINKEHIPDLKYIISATETIAYNLVDGDLILIESTIHPGTCEEVIKPILDEANKKYFLAHCPERINPGDTKWNVSNIPRVVGGITLADGELAAHFYKSLGINTLCLNNLKEAEATKILENTFRDINIAFVNEMSQSFDKLGIDITEVIKGASTKPFGYMPHYPGVGVGGHCIAVDPYYMIKKGKDIGFNHRFLKLAREINTSMPKYTIVVLQDELNKIGKPIKNTKICVLGLSYKADVVDDRESPSYEIIKLLRNKGANLIIYDPHFLEQSNVNSLDEAVKDADVIILCTAHKEFLENQELFKDAKIIVDGRNKLDKNLFTKTIYRGIGK